MGRGNRTGGRKEVGVVDNQAPTRSIRRIPDGYDTLASAEFLYHVAPKKSEESIREKGLVSGRQGLTKEGDWADSIYGKRPVYLSLKPSRSRHTSYVDLGAKQTIYQIETPDINELLPDLPGLVDAGAVLDEEGIYWEEGEEPEELNPYLDEGYISYTDILGNPDIIEAAINITGTAAIKSVPSSSLRIIK